MALGYLTTHVLDTARGCPASGLQIRLSRIEADGHHQITIMTTNQDGRTDSPILPKGACIPAHYELVFEAGNYFRSLGHDDDLLFLDDIPVRFAIDDAEQHYHVPLLLSPFGYSTYRGS